MEIERLFIIGAGASRAESELILESNSGKLNLDLFPLVLDYFDFLDRYFAENANDKARIDEIIAEKTGYDNYGDFISSFGSDGNIETALEYLFNKSHPNLVLDNLPDGASKFKDEIARGIFQLSFKECIELLVERPIAKLYHSYSDQIDGGVPPLNSKFFVLSLKPDDVIISLNYDLFIDEEIEKNFKKVDYDGSDPNIPTLLKPHGSISFSPTLPLNGGKHQPSMIRNIYRETNGDFSSLGMFQGPGNNTGKQLSSIYPPIKTKEDLTNFPNVQKEYNFIAKLMPKELVFWGIGLAKSDILLVDILKKIIKPETEVSIINIQPEEKWISHYKEVLNMDDNHHIEFFDNILKYLSFKNFGKHPG